MGRWRACLAVHTWPRRPSTLAEPAHPPPRSTKPHHNTPHLTTHTHMHHPPTHQVFAFGVTLYEILERKRPFAGMDGFQIQTQASQLGQASPAPLPMHHDRAGWRP